MGFGTPIVLRSKNFNILDYNAVGGGLNGLQNSGLPGNTNDLAIQNAVAAAKAAGGGFVVIPNDRFYTSTSFILRLPPRVHLVGDGYGPFDLSQRGDGVVTDPVQNTQGPTIILTNSTGQALFFGDTAIIVYDGNQVISDIIFACVQPPAIQNGPTYAPTQYPWVIAGDDNVPNIWLGGCEIVRCMIYAAWKGIQFWGGRSRCIDTTIEAFSIGLQIDGTADVSYLRGLRFWPLHADVAGVSDFITMNTSKFQLANLTALRLRRADEVQVQQLFVQTCAIGVDFADNGSTIGPWGTFFDTYLETCVIGINVSSIGLNGVQFFGGSIIPNYISDTNPNNTWLRVNAVAGRAVSLLIEGICVGAGPNSGTLMTIPMLDPNMNGVVHIKNCRNYNGPGGIASGPLGRTSQTNTLGGNTISDGYPLFAPPGNGVTFFVTASTTGTATIQRAALFTTTKLVLAKIPPNTTCPIHMIHGETVNVFSSDPNNVPTFVAVGD